MRALFVQIGTVGPTDATVHIHGETGSGKERVARAVHETSPRRARCFQPVNAAALSDELFQSTLFGHVRGAFTGASSDRPGLVATAEGGTLFLDEVSELSPRNQAGLLRFLEAGEYHRVGDPHVRRADVRIVTAANARLRERVESGRFREDLMYRLDTFEIELPPLRERGGDIVLLARHFLASASQEVRKPPLHLSAEAEAALAGYRWPGNVRELESLMTRMAISAAGPVVRAEDLGPNLESPVSDRAAGLRALLACHERREVARVLDACAGNRTLAARSLGISRQGLHAKLRRLGLADRSSR